MADDESCRYRLQVMSIVLPFTCSRPSDWRCYRQIGHWSIVIQTCCATAHMTRSAESYPKISDKRTVSQRLRRAVGQNRV